MKSTLESVSSKKEAAVLKALQTVYFLVKSDISNNKYQEILEWLEFMGVAELANLSGGSNATYTSHHILEDFQDSIAQVITESINLKIANSPFITVLVDESTDITVLKKLCIYFQIMNTTTMAGETIFIENVQVAGGDAKTIHDEIVRVIKARNVDMHKVIGLGSDGAAVSIVL